MKSITFICDYTGGESFLKKIMSGSRRRVEVLMLEYTSGSEKGLRMLCEMVLETI